ncbi:hypothetical protein [Oculatella sp. LEGE 06141]|nr:hypothetical protein [Oculatella sp. LEGE 06141]
MADSIENCCKKNRLIYTVVVWSTVECCVGLCDRTLFEFYGE